MVSPRAPALPPAERRRHLIDVTVDLLRQHGRAVTVREIAEAAGVAEGTIFRVFASKDDLVTAALQHAFDPEPTVQRLLAIDAELPLRERLVAVVAALQDRFAEVFELTEAMGTVTLPEKLIGEHRDHHERAREVGNAQIAALAARDAGQLRVEPQEVARLLQMLTFAGTHRRVNQGVRLSPEEIVAVVLDGVRVTELTGAPC